jgi:hypothetical protein
MTIRQILRKRFWSIFSMLITLCGLIVLSSVALLKLRWFGVAVAVLFLPPLILGFAFSLFLLRCPRCKANLSSLIGYFGPLAFMAKPVNYCPFCGVSVDEPLEPQPGAPADGPRAARSASG